MLPRESSAAFGIGVYLFGLASIAAGIINIAWGAFEAAHQPLQAFGDHIPGSSVIAYVVSAALVAGGAMVLTRTSARAGAVILGLCYALFTIFWLPRLYTAPHYMGFHAAVIVGVLDGLLQQMFLVAAALLIYAWAGEPARTPAGLTWTARIIIGVSSVLFGANHLLGITQTAAMVPSWMPAGQTFWVIVTGIAFILAGIAILIGVLDVLAARLLAAMLLVFSALALLPILIAYPHNQIPWGSNAYNLAAVATAWIYASWIALRPAVR